MRLLRDVGLITAVVGYLLFAWVTLDRRGSEERIVSLVEDAVKAVNERDLGGVLRYVSRDYRDDEGFNRERIRMLLAQGMRTETKYHASARVDDITVGGDQAVLRVFVSVENDIGAVFYKRTLTLRLRQEAARHALIFPVKTWRIVSAGDLGINETF